MTIDHNPIRQVTCHCPSPDVASTRRQSAPPPISVSNLFVPAGLIPYIFVLSPRSFGIGPDRSGWCRSLAGRWARFVADKTLRASPSQSRGSTFLLALPE